MIDTPNYLNKIIPFINKQFIKVITCSNRIEISTIVEMIKNTLLEEFNVTSTLIHTYQFNNILYNGMNSKEMYLELKSKIVEGKKNYFLLDDVQNISSWERVLNSLNDEFDVDIYVVGTNHDLMPSKIDTYLTGRYVLLKI